MLSGLYKKVTWKGRPGFRWDPSLPITRCWLESEILSSLLVLVSKHNIWTCAGAHTVMTKCLILRILWRIWESPSHHNVREEGRTLKSSSATCVPCHRPSPFSSACLSQRANLLDLQKAANPQTLPAASPACHRAWSCRTSWSACWTGTPPPRRADPVPAKKR